MYEAIKELLNNGAFWGFLGTFSVAYFGYKGLLVPAIEERKKRKAAEGNGYAHKINLQRVTTFEELKDVVGILQAELKRRIEDDIEKDKRHAAERQQWSAEVQELREQIEHLKERLRKAHINNE